MDSCSLKPGMQAGNRSSIDQVATLHPTNTIIQACVDGDPCLKFSSRDSLDITYFINIAVQGSTRVILYDCRTHALSLFTDYPGVLSLYFDIGKCGWTTLKLS